MLLKQKNLLPVVCYLLTVGCADQATRPALVPVEERNSPAVEQGQESGQDASQARAAEPVILALMNEADSYAQQGDTARASSTIERALRIEPRNALLWQRLAKVRLQQQQWQQAIALARKSNALAAQNRQLQSENWGIIAQAYEKLGQPDKAREARNRQTASG